MKNNKTFYFLLLTFFIFSCTNYPKAVEDKNSSGNFFYTSGTNIYTPEGEPFIIKGIAFGNRIWDNPSSPPKEHHTADSYKKMKALGFNTVRFYINYGLFESDAEPYKYHETGFDWLRQNIQWAKENGMYLIVNMHYPQGGYQSNGEGLELFEKKSNQKRLAALWNAIAKEFAEESTILGWGIVNEPVPLYDGKSAESSLKTWEELANNLVDAIRKADKNHIIFVEKANGIKDLEGNWYGTDLEHYYPEIKDGNFAYEAHFYEPLWYTHQGTNWTENKFSDSIYPDENTGKMAGNVTWYSYQKDIQPINYSTETWIDFEAPPVKTTGPEISSVAAVVQAENLMDTGKVYVDNVVIEEYDRDNTFVRIIFQRDFEKEAGFWLWCENPESGEALIISDPEGKSGQCVLITGTRGDANITMGFIPAKQDYTYKLKIRLKTREIPEEAYIRGRLDFGTGGSPLNFNRDYLNEKILNHKIITDKKNKPLYIGEFGAYYVVFEENQEGINRGGAEYIKDVLNIFTEENIGFTFHAYHEEAFGLYQSSPWVYPDDKDLNQELYRIFLSELKK